MKAQPQSYRPDIDGIRALAVLAVLGFHAAPSMIPGGFVGVDIFFVISGFLITGIIVRGLESDTFSFVNFWARRIRRIFPALLLMLLGVLLAGWIYLLPAEFDALKDHAQWGLGFAANFRLNAEAGYFDYASELKPLLHLWSLAIEEQFYLVWPLILWGCHRLKINLFAATLVLAMLGFGIRKLLPLSSVEAFYLPWARFWELQLGALLAFAGSVRIPLARGPWSSAKPFLRQISGPLGLALMGYACFAFDSGTPHPSRFTLIPLAGAALAFIGGKDAWFNRYVLSLKPLVTIGLISYPLYLWHWPILSFLRIIQGKLTVETTCVALLASFLLAFGTYRVEHLFRHESIRFRWRAPALLLTLGVLFLFTKHSEIQSNAAKTDAINNISLAIGNWKYPGPGMTQRRFADGFPYYEIATDIRKYTLFIGDSHMEQYGPRIELISKERPRDTYSSIWITGGGCLLVDTFPLCNELKKKIREILTNPQRYNIERVVWTQSWMTYFENSVYETFDREDPAIKIGKRKKSIAEFLDFLSETKLEVLVLLDTPHGPEFNPMSMISRSLKGRFDVNPGLIARNLIENRNGISNQFLAAEVEGSPIKLVDPLKYLCGETSCPTRDQLDRPLCRDDTHFTTYSARRLLTYIDRSVVMR